MSLLETKGRTFQMKKLILAHFGSRTLVILSFIMSSFAHADSQYKTSQTFMPSDPFYHHVGATSFLWRTVVADKNDTGCGAFRVMPFYQRSLQRCDDGSYFLIDCKNSILFAGDASPLREKRDVRAEWFNLPATFSGYLSLQPQETQYGAVLSYNHSFKDLIGSKLLENSWLEITIPFGCTTHQLHPHEYDITTTTHLKAGQPGTILEALNQPTLLYDKISNCKMKKCGMAEVQLTWGTTFINKDDFLLTYYTTFVIPGNTRPDARHLFFPTLGSNGHFGINAGLNVELPLLEEDQDCSLKIFASGENHFLFKRKQWRTFDLREQVVAIRPTGSFGRKEWSRFLLLRHESSSPTNLGANNELIPAANVTTLKVEVYPQSNFNMVAGLLWENRSFTAEVGYQLTARQDECVRLLLPCCEGSRFKFEEYGIAGTEPGTTASASTIAEQADNDPAGTFVNLTWNNINRISGAGRAEFVQGVHAAFGFNNDCIFAGIGGFFEQPHTNTNLSSWAVWLNAGFQF